MADHVLFDPLGRHTVFMLRRDYHGVDPDRLVPVIFHRHLGLAVGPQVRYRAVPADFGKSPRKPVRQRDGHRHQFGGLVAREPEHHALVTGAYGLDLRFVQPALLRFEGFVDAQGDIAGLFVDGNKYRTCIAVKSKA